MNYYNYFTEIEEHFVRRRGKHLLISPMDWGLIATWRDAGVPLQVAIRGIDIAMDAFFAKPRGNTKVNTLCYCHDSVMTEYANHLESRVGESVEAGTESFGSDSAAGEEPGIPAMIGFVSERICEIKALTEKQFQGSTLDAIGRAQERLQEVRQSLGTGSRLNSETLERDLTIIDDLLVTGLSAAIPPEQLLEWEKEAKKELKLYRKRLPKETYEKIYSNFMRDKVRRNFNVGELSIFRL